MSIIKRTGNIQKFSSSKLKHFFTRIKGISPSLHSVDVDLTYDKINKGLTDQISSDDMLKFLSSSCAALSTQSYDYSILAGRIEMVNLYKITPDSFTDAMNRLESILDTNFLEKVNQYDFDQHIVEERDFTYDIIGVKTLQRSYLLKDEKGFVERPQYMLMRVAVFLADTPEEAIQTYDFLSRKYYTHATPTLFHSGMKRHQLASCFLMTMKDDSIDGIFDTVKNAAKISKSAGGIGFSVSNIRAKGSPINGTNGHSSGLVPMLRVFNNTARYVDQGGGKRKGSFAVFIEPWHADVQDVLKLKLNHGVEEERARDLFYSMWIPDIFMKRVESDGDWALFCPTKVPGLQDAYGPAFDTMYEEAEKAKLYKTKIKARVLWNQILDTQIETGTPYLMYKDACNMKSNQSNLGTIRSSNLCAEVVQYSNKNEVSVCTLASICLPKCTTQDGFDFDKLAKITTMVTKNLNKVVDKTSYPLKETLYSNTKNRPIGIGVQGLADVFQLMGIAYDSKEAANLNTQIFETIYYHALKTSSDIAKTDGAYQSFENCPAHLGKLQFDLWNHEPTSMYDWESLKQTIKTQGLRNSLLVACMPTASTAQINGNTESFEPRTSNLYVRRVLSGEFVIINKYLESACRKINRWNKKLIDNIIANKGSIQNTNLPQEMKNTFKTVWEMSQKSLIDLSVGRAPFVCQSQSLNLYISQPTRNILTSMHFYAWKKGLKTGIYYLRTQPKSNAIAFTACESCSA